MLAGGEGGSGAGSAAGFPPVPAGGGALADVSPAGLDWVSKPQSPQKRSPGTSSAPQPGQNFKLLISLPPSFYTAAPQLVQNFLPGRIFSPHCPQNLPAGDWAGAALAGAVPPIVFCSASIHCSKVWFNSGRVLAW